MRMEMSVFLVFYGNLYLVNIHHLALGPTFPLNSTLILHFTFCTWLFGFDLFDGFWTLYIFRTLTFWLIGTLSIQFFLTMRNYYILGNIKLHIELKLNWQIKLALWDVFNVTLLLASLLCMQMMIWWTLKNLRPNEDSDGMKFMMKGIKWW